MSTTNGKPTDEPLEQIAENALDRYYVAVIAEMLVDRDHKGPGLATRLAQLPDWVRERYEENAALAIRGSDAAYHWPAVYYALSEWVGDDEVARIAQLGNSELGAERHELAKVVAGIIKAYKAALLGDVPPNELRRLGLMAFEDLGRLEVPQPTENG